MNNMKEIANLLTCDSFFYLWDEIVKDFVLYRNILAVVGALYLTKTAFGIVSSAFRSVAAHGISRFIPVCLTKSGSWAVVTGPTAGIGRAFAVELAKRGMSILLLGRNEDKLNELADYIKTQYNQETKIVIIDFNNPGKDYQKVREVFDTIEIAVVVNNAGTINSHPSFLHETDEDIIKSMINVNIVAVTKMTQMAVCHMRKRKRGFIINISSIASIAPAPLLQVYAATKAYVTSFSRAVHAEVRNEGITVQTLIPSYIKTRMVGYSPYLSTSWFVPSPEVYARNALNTLKYSSYTTGYWLHGVQESFVSLLPVTWYMYVIQKTNILFRQEYLDNQVN